MKELPWLWSLLGGLLPASIRDGVFEPACLDLWRDRVMHESSVSLWRRRSVGILVMGYLLAAAWYGIPRYLNRGPRSNTARWVSRVGIVLLALAALLVLGPAALQYINYGGS